MGVKLLNFKCYGCVMLDCLTGLKIEAKKGFKMICWYVLGWLDGRVGELEAILGGILMFPECCEFCGQLGSIRGAKRGN